MKLSARPAAQLVLQTLDSLPEQIVLCLEQNVLFCCQLVSFPALRSEPSHICRILSAVNICRAWSAVFQPDICVIVA
ncbi:MAG: hypothetical protein J6S41_04725 [Clostridia bacterium]|nr:hypothetical protein [Clostridia bacterium]